jgi:DNA modification methylase
MTLIHLRTLLDHLGVELTARGDKLHYKAAAGVLTPEVKAALAAHKAALLATLAGTDGPGPPPADRGWRRAVATWPVEWRERWGRRANELQDHGEPWDASEWIAFNELAPDLAEAERRGEVVCVDPPSARGSAPRHRPDSAETRGLAADCQIIQGDARLILPTQPAQFMHCCVTSPPYFWQRDYGGGPGEIGRERTPEEHISALVEVFREVGRVLRPDGLLFVVIGDSYHRGSLLEIPARLALAMRKDGWHLRDRIVWSKARMVGDVLKGHCMPGSQKGRCTNSHETVLQFARHRSDYYFDGEGVRAASGAMLRNVWEISINTEPNRLGHFALMPRDLAELCIRLGTSERGCCPKCGAPWRRVVEKDRVPTRPGRNNTIAWVDRPDSPYAQHRGSVIGNRDRKRHKIVTRTVGWEPTCKCGTLEVVPCRVLDPFGGLGTTGVVAASLGRDSTVIELNPEYCEQARLRIRQPHSPPA